MAKKNLADYEGPRSLWESELPAAAELARSIFFPQSENWRQAAATWPMALHPEYADSTFAMFHQGEPVSLISRLERELVIFGHPLRVGFIGGVCTHPDHRSKGLASTLLAASLNQLHANGVDFVYISGARGLYYAAGANHVGGRLAFRLRGDALADLNPASSPPCEGGARGGMNLRAANPEDAARLSQLYQREPVRFVRPREDYELVLRYGHCSGQACQFLLLELGGIPAGYLLVAQPREREGRLSQHVLEYCGERSVVLAGLWQLAAEGAPGQELSLEVSQGDPLGERLCRLGLVGEPAGTSGTVKVLDFGRSMAKLQPYFEGRLGRADLGDMQCVAGGGRYVAHTAQDILEIEGETNLLWTLLGAPPGKSVENVRATGVMRQLIAQCWPLPLPSLYLNMI